MTGDSIYNLLRLGEVDTGKDDRPLDPAPKILSVEVRIVIAESILVLSKENLDVYLVIYMFFFL